MANSSWPQVDVVCFSPSRWDFNYQRPQHLLKRFAKCFRVFYIEEPVFNSESDRYQLTMSSEHVFVVTPQLQDSRKRSDVTERQCEIIGQLFQEEKIQTYIFWHYTPLALILCNQFNPVLTIYDCIGQCYGVHGAVTKENEKELFERSDIVFAAGQSLFENKKKFHKHIYSFPNRVDKNHFEQARSVKFDPPDQDSIPHPRIGYFGTIDDRIDVELLSKIAQLRPRWHFIMVGPIVNIDPTQLPNFSNIHYLGHKRYAELPDYIGQWDIAMIPFVHDESTRLLNPLKTSEYLAAGRPVISTPINDVIRPFGNMGLVNIAGTHDEFIRAAEILLKRDDKDKCEWTLKVDSFLAEYSWNKTWAEMMSLIGPRVAELTKEAVEDYEKESQV